jgi:hypothetical protein
MLWKMEELKTQRIKSLTEPMNKLAKTELTFLELFNLNKNNNQTDV